jgi:2-polyprenyl-3-methyl-5-hydroxy-6-metoxy-1,4-benzoquinol methylase
MPTPIHELPALYTTGTFPDLAVHNHGLRMEAVINALASNDTRHMIDLGCGDGALVKRIAQSSLQLKTYIGVDTWHDRLEAAGSGLSPDDTHVEFREGSMTDLHNLLHNPAPYRKLGAVVLLETIEHVPRDQVQHIESGVFGHVSPDLVVVTTPDATKRLNTDQLSARGHHFEWDIAEFQEWATDVTERYEDYSFKIAQLSGPTFVRNTQIATFKKCNV